jgi:hypothetical protein
MADNTGVPNTLPLYLVQDFRPLSARNRRNAMTPTEATTNRFSLDPRYLMPRRIIFAEKKKRKIVTGGWYDSMNNGALIQRLITEDKNFHDRLFKFAQAEYSEETILFFDDLVRLKSMRDSQQKRVEFERIYHRYIQSGSELEVNMAFDLRENLGQFVGLDITQEVEEQLNISAMTSLLDVFQRFEKSNLFEGLKTS